MKKISGTRVSDTNPLLIRKSQLTFTKDYSEQDFHKDCVWVEIIFEKKLLNKDSLELLAYFLIGKLNDDTLTQDKIARETAKYLVFLRKLEKSDAKNKKDDLSELNK